MSEENRPVSYQQTLGTKTERIRAEVKEQNNNHNFSRNDEQKVDANSQK